MGKKRQLVLTKPKNPESPIDGTLPLGSQKEFIAKVGEHNLAPDGGEPGKSGTLFLHGPGMILEFAASADPIHQALITVTDTDFAWPVLSKICKLFGWKMQDVESGNYFG